MVTPQNPRLRREPAPNPFKPPHRSSRECVVKAAQQVGALSDMPCAEDSDETLPEDEYVPGKFLTLCLSRNFDLLGFCWGFVGSSYLLA
jgi:hypothetical protein